MSESAVIKYDAILFLSFGGPEGMSEVLPFLENVLRGRNVPPERMKAVARHYELFGGVSPINEQNRQLITALKTLLEEQGPHLPVYFGNRNWHPLLADTLRRMREDGIRNALAFVTSAYSSYSGCRQYREDIARALEEVGDGAPKIDKLRVFYNHPGFIAPNIENLSSSLSKISPERHRTTEIAFTAHSIPLSMAAGCSYKEQLEETCRLIIAGVFIAGVSDAAKHLRWNLVFQSRSGPPTQPWLEPDIYDHLVHLKESGTTDVVVAPIGFISDHMEVLYDLDVRARQQSEEMGLNMERMATVGAHPKFVRMIRDLIIERTSEHPLRLFLGGRGPNHDVCSQSCCLLGAPFTIATMRSVETSASRATLQPPK
ncbi:MAG: ferrochelatase [Pyrinomonadaceae bacterium]